MLDSFRSRLVISNLLIILLGLLFVVAVFIQLLAQRSYDAKRAELAKQSNAVAAQIHRLYVSHASVAALRQWVFDASRLLGERIIVVSPMGQHVVDSAEKTPFDSGSWYAVDTRALHSGRSASASRKSQNLLLFQAPIPGTDYRDGGAILMEARVTDVRPSVGSLVAVGLVLAASAILVWLLVGTYFTFSVFRPLVRVIHATERMARGDYAARVPVHGTGEISRLASSFNAMADQVQQTNRTHRDFVANVSHDLRTPLTLVSGFSQALLDGTAGPSEVEALAEVIHVEAGKMQRLVEDLLQLTNLESGLLTLQPRAVDTRAFVQSAVNRAVHAHAGGGVTVENRVPAETPAIYIDPDRFERALQNLLDNALQYTPTGGRVMIDALLTGRNEIRIEVADSGPGISDQDIPRVFERFYRSDRSRERDSGHAGLGLAIVREIVEAHGGQVGLTTEVGRGTTFWLEVPRAPRGAMVEKAPSPSQETVTS